MNDAFIYRLMSAADIPEVSELVTRVFNEFVAPEYSPEGVQEFYGYIQPTAFRARSQTSHFAILALARNKVAGMIEMRDCNHVSLLFVAAEFQHRGVARELLRQAVQICRADKPGLSHITVNSSSYAVPIYERLGFHQAGRKQVRNGIGFVPMVKRI